MAHNPAEIAEAENQALRQQIAELMAVNAQLQTILGQRAEPIANAVLDTVTNWCTMAENPQHPAHAVAQQLVEKWVAANRRAEQVAAKIRVVRTLPNGRGS